MNHLYRIWQFESSDCNGDRQEAAHVRAKDIDQVIDWVKNYYFKPEYINELNVDGFDEESAVIDYSIAYDEKGNEIENLYDVEDTDDLNWVTNGYQIELDDDAEEDFHTIYGGNDFFDITDGQPKTKGKPTAEQIEKAGSMDKAFYTHAGKGFETNNPENNFNLNTSKVKLWDPKK